MNRAESSGRVLPLSDHVKAVRGVEGIIERTNEGAQ